MTSRRSILGAGGGSLAAWALRPWPLAAAPVADPSRIALVIGNDRYAQVPLANATNDARSMAALLRDAGFTVDARLDASHAAMREAVRAFAEAAVRPQVKTAFFFYAGHGVQIDWRNYLLPVDAQVAGVGDVRTHGVELAALLGPLAAARDKVFVILLDACRDNPFGDRYQPEQKGLSQFDAPSGSLIGFSTAPGAVASDGSGAHGLYTENLVRELAVRGARLEDALKRVRVNVRLASKGAQVPWESTSLESDVYVFPPERPPTPADEEKVDREELAAIAPLRGSRDADAWAKFIRAYPRGKFSEIAQARLEQLVPEKRRTSTPPRQNPNTGGTFPLERHFSVGDSAIYEDLDHAPGSRRRSITQLVTRVDAAADRVEFNQGAFVTDLLGNPIKLPHLEFDAPVQMAPAVLQVGRRWSARYRQVLARGRRELAFDLDLAVVRRERVTVPAGTFDAFRIEGRARSSQIEGGLVIWEVPGLNFPVQRNRILKRGDRVLDTERVQLVSWSQARRS